MSLAPLTPLEQKTLLRLARESIQHRLARRKAFPPLPDDLPPRLQADGAAFVTLTLHGSLRGCIGSLIAHNPLAVDVQRNAQAAAFEDPRFSPLTVAEAPQTRIEISVLSPAEPLDYAGPDDLLRQLHPGSDGIVLQHGWNRATFLPQVWEQLPEPERFLENLCRKAGLPINAWQWPDLELSTYQVQKFTEAPEEP